MTAQTASATDTLLLDYDLTELPTAQHKAGLAGLLLHLKNLEERKRPNMPIVERVEPLGASIRVTAESLRALFADLYAGGLDDVWVRSKYANKPPLDERTEVIERAGKTETIKRYLYQELRPQCEVIAHWRPAGKQDPWFRLWKSMLWSVLRAQPKTRGVYDNEPDRTRLAAKLWKGLVKSAAQRAKGVPVVDSIAGSLFIGAQDKNAERVDFAGLVEHNLLLHFWQWAAPVFVPRSIDPQKGTWEYQGYLFAIPEVADLIAFTDAMKRYWQGLTADAIGYRPADALVDMPEEGGLEFLYHLARDRIELSNLSATIHAVELYHQLKQGNNVRQLAAERVAPSAGVLARYRDEIRDDRRRHPLFKRLLIRNLLQAQPWYHGAIDLFERFPIHAFVHAQKTPPGRFFGTDARRKFKAVIADLSPEETSMTEEERDDAVQSLIFRVIRNYVEKRARDRARIDENKLFDSFTEAEIKQYREAKPKVANTAFLALRGRRAQDVAEYFTGTLCAVGFHLKEADFLLLADRLLKDPDQVKTLAMLALSAHSWSKSPDAQELTSTAATAATTD
jgi:CRISPR-associated protein Cmx8